MIAVPLEVISIQSPWRHTPSYMSKYLSCSREPSSSPQKNRGIDGSGAVSTSSPISPITGRPPGPPDSPAAPSERACNSPCHTGSVGTPPTNAVHTSVPPDVEKSHVSPPSCEYIQSNPS